MLRPLILVCCFALAACSQTVGGYRQAAPSLAEPGADAVDTRGTYLDLIRRMQKQGAYYASLAHIEAFRQRHGDSPALRLLQADALRHTGQLDAAGTLYDGLTRGEQAAAAWHGLGLIAAQRDQDAVAEAALARAAQLTPLATWAMRGCVPASWSRPARRSHRRWNWRRTMPARSPTWRCGRCCAATPPPPNA